MTTPRHAASQPFDPFSFATGEALVGREADLQWLQDGLQPGVVSHLSSVARMGASSVVMEAVRTWGASTGSIAARFDLGRHTAASLGAAGEQVCRLAGAAGGLPASLMGDLTKLGPDLMNGALGAGEGAELPTAFLRALGALGARAAAAGRTAAVVIDSFQRADGVGGRAWKTELIGQVRASRSLCCVIIDRVGNEAAAKPQPDAVRQRELGPVDPSRLAAWLEGRAAQRGPAEAGWGEACVARAGNRVGDVVMLAYLASQHAARQGCGPQAALEPAFREWVSREEKAAEACWARLAAPERKVVVALACGAASRLDGAEAHRRCGLESPEAVAAALRGAATKGAVERSPSRGPELSSPSFRGWVLSAQVRLHRTREASQPSTQSRITFDFRVERTRDQRIAP